ncbi:MAG: tetratricopeptide repeat protein [Rikenellaceae bacterium]
MRSLKIYLVIFAVVLSNIAAFGAMEQSFTVPEPQEKIEAMSVKELWDRGNTAYANGNYMRAEHFYSEILSRDTYSAELYYNLGNVHHKRGELALSLLYYYKALRLAPSDSDILHNIEVVKAETKDNIEQMPRLFLVEWFESVESLMGCREWSILSILLFAIVLGALLLYLLAESLKMRKVGFAAVLFAGILFIVATNYALAGRAELLSPSEAVVMSKSISVKSSPSGASTELFIIHEGTKVEVVSKHESWSEILLDDGKKGWVESRRIEEI